MDSPLRSGSHCASSSKKSRHRVKKGTPTMKPIREEYEPPKKSASARKPPINEGTQGCSQKAYCNALAKVLTPDRRAFIVAADLGHLLQLQPMNIRRHMCRWLAKKYDVKAKAFILEGKPVRMTIDDVENLMGLHAKGQDFHPIFSGRTSALYAKLKDKQKSSISFSSLIERMSDPNLPLEDFLQCFVLYTIGRVLCPTTSFSVNSKYLGMVDTVQKVKSINWAKLTLDHLLASIENYRLGKANLEGNLPLLQLWYWEKFRVSHLDDTVDYTQRQVPLMQYWNEEKSRKIDRIYELHGFAAGEYVEDYLQPPPPPPAKKNSTKKVPMAPQNMPSYNPQLLNRLEEFISTIDQKKLEHDQLRADVDTSLSYLRAIMAHHGIKTAGIESQAKFGDNVNRNLETSFDMEHAQEPEKSLKRKRQDNEASGTIGQRLRGPSGRTPIPSMKADFIYSGKDMIGKFQSASKVQSASGVRSHANATEDNTTDYNETMSQRDIRREQMGKVKVIKVPGNQTDREEEEEILNWVNTTEFNVSMVRIDSISISQRHLASLTNPYLDDSSKYLGDEIIDAFIEHHKLTKPMDVRDDSILFIERALNTMALENDGRKNAEVRLRMGRSRKGIDYITHRLIFLPIHMETRQHWFLVSINTNTQTIQILNSIKHELIEDEATRQYLLNTLKGMESHIKFVIQQYGEANCVWKRRGRNYNVSTWRQEVIEGIPLQEDSTSCGLFLIMNMLNWNGRSLEQQFDQETINKFRPKLAVTLVKSPHNKEKRPRLD